MSIDPGSAPVRPAYAQDSDGLYYRIGGAGAHILTGAGAPSDLVGEKGNYYLDTTNDVLYGPRQTTVPYWPTAVDPPGEVAKHVALVHPHTQYLQDTGDTMSGNLVIARASPILYLNDTGTSGSNIYMQRNGVNRWVLRTITTEAGSDTGSDLQFSARHDDGTAGPTALSINRATGLITVVGEPTATLGIATRGYADKKVAKTGDTMSGALSFDGYTGNNDGLWWPTPDAWIAYYSGRLGAFLGATGAPIRFGVGTPTTGTDAANKDYVDLGFQKKQKVAYTPALTGWWRIASLAPMFSGATTGDQPLGGRAAAVFRIYNNQSSRHDFLELEVTHSYGSSQLNIVRSNQFGSVPAPAISQVRLVEGGTYDGCAVEVNVAYASVPFYVEMEQAESYAPGFTLLSTWTAGAIPSGMAAQHTYGAVPWLRSSSDQGYVYMEKSGDLQIHSVTSGGNLVAGTVWDDGWIGVSESPASTSAASLLLSNPGGSSVDTYLINPNGNVTLRPSGGSNNQTAFAATEALFRTKIVAAGAGQNCINLASAVGSGKSAILRVDGNDFYCGLISDSYNGTYNANRPMRIQLSDGHVCFPDTYSKFTTASAANLGMGAAGELVRSTSTYQMKHDIIGLDGTYPPVVPEERRMEPTVVTRQSGSTPVAADVLNITPVQFVSDKEFDGSRIRVGAIAEDVAQHAPWALADGQDSIEWPSITAALLQVVKDQQTRIDQLEARLDAIEAAQAI